MGRFRRRVSMPRMRLRETRLRYGDFVNPITLIRNWISEFKRRRALKKRIEELRKRDPFIYK
jgi:hypothetical protein